jgi:TP901-1 family phage major tail protein
MPQLQANDVRYFYKFSSEPISGQMNKIAFEGDTSLTSSANVQSTETKDGTIKGIGAPNQQISVVFPCMVGDDAYAGLKKAHLKREIIHVWRVELGNKNEDGSYPAMYFQAYVPTFSPTEAVGQGVTLTEQLEVNGVGKDGTLAEADIPTGAFDGDYTFAKPTEAGTDTEQG